MIDLKQGFTPETTIDLGECVYLQGTANLLTIDGKQYLRSGNVLSNVASSYPEGYAQFGTYVSNVTTTGGWSSNSFGLAMISISYANGIIFLCAYNSASSTYQLMRSTDGATFTTINYPFPTTNAVRKVAYVLGAYVAVGGLGDNNIMKYATSTSFVWVTWFATTGNGQFIDVVECTFAGVKYLVTATAGGSSFAPSLFSFTALGNTNPSLMLGNGAVTQKFYALAFDPIASKLYMAVYLGGSNDIATFTSAGVTGTNIPVVYEQTGMLGGTVQSLAYNAAYKCIVATYNEKVSVKNLTTNVWTSRSPTGMAPTSGSKCSVSVDGTMLYVTLNGDYAYSLDGGATTFIKGPALSLSGSGYQDVTYGNNRFVIIGGTGDMVSADVATLGVPTKITDSSDSTLYMRVK